MDKDNVEKGVGRGRGRGRGAPQYEAPASPPSVSRRSEREDDSTSEEEAQRKMDAAFEQMYMREGAPSVCDSERGRSRGRGAGAGRGRIIDAGRSVAPVGFRAIVDAAVALEGVVDAAAVARLQEIAARYEDDDFVVARPRSPIERQVEQDSPPPGTPPEQGTPPGQVGTPPDGGEEDVAEVQEDVAEAVAEAQVAARADAQVAGPAGAQVAGPAGAQVAGPAGAGVQVDDLPPEHPGRGDGQRDASMTSMGHGSAGVSSRTREEEDEPPVVSRIGSKGTPVPLLTNYLRLKIKEGHPGLVQYHVSIEPSQDSVGWRRKVLSTVACEAVLGKVKSFDGMILFLPSILRQDVTVIKTVMEREPDVPITVTITYTRVTRMADALPFFNVLLRRMMHILDYKELRREYYDVNIITALNQHKLEIWPGLSVVAENQEDGLMICVDSRSRVLRQDTVYDHLNSLKGDPQMKDKFANFIVNKIVITKYNHKCYKIDDVSWDQQPDSLFEYRNAKISFVDYIKQRYPVGDNVITDMKQPMLISKLKPRKNDKFKEDEERWAALVPQCCYITGLTEDQKANFKVMTDLAASTRLIPAKRVTDLNNYIARLLGNEAVNQLLDNWGLTIERSIIDIMGRRCEGPTLEFNQRMVLKNSGPDFSREAGRAVYEPIEVRSYVLICTQRDTDKAKRFMDTYKEVCGPLGIRMTQLGRIVALKGYRPTDFSEALKEHCNDQVHFVVVIMPQARDDVYAAIKRHCVSTRPIPSQCIVSKTLGNEKRLRSIVLKIALQINCKLGGSLWAMRMPLKDKIMFIGIDAAHDPLKKDASVICLVASLNNECTKYFSKSTTSKVHQELADSLRMMTEEAIKAYVSETGKHPDQVVVYRDGGSVGAIDTILQTELSHMKAAMESCGPNLKFTFCLVTKRISQRFFLKKGGKIDNPEPGTLIDSVVTRRYLYDFYVVSQLVRQGTVNPTHFIVANTADPIRPDLIQKLSYVTCFMYYNWSGTVRVPAMVQYAHKLAALLSRHVKASPHRDISRTLYYL